MGIESRRFDRADGVSVWIQVALLAGMVGPRVAAAAARAAVVAIAEDEPGVTELPFMQSSKTHSGQKRQAGQAMQSRAERYVTSVYEKGMLRMKCEYYWTDCFGSCCKPFLLSWHFCVVSMRRT